MDFNSALGRLLRAGGLRDDFRTDPERVLASFALSAQDRRAIVGLSYDDLEVQADILLRKRFDTVKRLAPRTCDAVGWPVFHAYARRTWPESAEADAAAFCDHAGCPVPAERNRVRFALGRAPCSLHLLGRSADCPAGLQVFLRRGKTQCEWFFALRL